MLSIRIWKIGLKWKLLTKWKLGEELYPRNHMPLLPVQRTSIQDQQIVGELLNNIIFF